jgi:actin-related protein
MDKSMLNRETKSNEMSDEDSFRMMYNAYKQEMEAAESPEEQKRIQQNFQEQTQNVDQEVKMNVFKEEDRTMKAEGSLLVPPEMGMESEMPIDTFTPEEQAMARESQVPDDQMEEDYMGFMLNESLDETEQEYLMGALESDPRLSEIFDKVVTTASEFSGAGKVEGPGDGVSDSIPARLSDGEFVITEEATSEIGADNLQTMMDDAERKASGGEMRVTKQMGGLLDNPYGMPNQQMEEEENRIEQSMLGANQMPSLMGGRR